MVSLRCLAAGVVFALVLCLIPPAASGPPYVKKASRQETILASLKAAGVPTLEGKWHYIGPFDDSDGRGFDAVYPPEKEVDLNKTYPGKGGAKVGWKEFPNFRVGRVNDLRRFTSNEHSCVYLTTEVETDEALDLPVALGSDDTLTV